MNLLSINWNRGSPSKESRIESKNQSELRRLSERKGRTLPLLAFCRLDRPRSRRSAHVCESPDFGTNNHGDVFTDHGHLALDTHLGDDCCGDAGVPAVFLGYLSPRLQGQGISTFANSIISRVLRGPFPRHAYLYIAEITRCLLNWQDRPLA